MTVARTTSTTRSFVCGSMNSSMSVLMRAFVPAPRSFPQIRFCSFALDHNLLSGSIPSQLGALSKMTTYLNLVSNQLSGSIPSQLGALTGMESDFKLGLNQLCDAIPSEVMALSTQVSGFDLGTPCPCPKGTFLGYDSKLEQSTCRDCPEGQFSDSVGSSQCSNCGSPESSYEGSSNCTVTRMALK